MQCEIPTGRALLHTLLAFAMVLNGTAIPVAAAAAGPEMAQHVQHLDHDEMSHSSGPGDRAPSPASDCCDGTICGCGCTAPLAAMVQPAAVERGPANDLVVAIFECAPRAAGPTGAPFRPPA